MKPIEIAKQLAMISAKRHVNIRGYVKEVEVLGQSANSKKYWHVLDGQKREMVHEDQFYHRDGSSGVLIARDVEFKRKHTGHDVRIELLATI